MGVRQGLVPIGFMLGFALLGLCQLVRRKSLWKVDRSLLVLGVLPTAAMQLKSRITRPGLRKAACFLLNAFAVLMVAGRLLSGVHWLTDIVGGVLLSAGLVLFYRGCVQFFETNKTSICILSPLKTTIHSAILFARLIFEGYL